MKHGCSTSVSLFTQSQVQLVEAGGCVLPALDPWADEADPAPPPQRHPPMPGLAFAAALVRDRMRALVVLAWKSSHAAAVETWHVQLAHGNGTANACERRMPLLCRRIRSGCDRSGTSGSRSSVLPCQCVRSALQELVVPQERSRRLCLQRFEKEDLDDARLAGVYDKATGSPQQRAAYEGERAPHLDLGMPLQTLDLTTGVADCAQTLSRRSHLHRCCHACVGCQHQLQDSPAFRKTQMICMMWSSWVIACQRLCAYPQACTSGATWWGAGWTRARASCCCGRHWLFIES